MNYITTVEMSRNWGISSRRISFMCSKGRIEGTIKSGRSWLIPIDAKKPEDLRKDRKMVGKTLRYYNEKAQKYVAGTLDIEFLETQEIFLGYIPHGGSILDFGCGSGRDTKSFLEKGYVVEALDGSKKLCDLANAYTGIKVKHMMFEEFEEVEKFDGIWACASILHVTKKELPTILKKMVNALKDNGTIYTSFKYGDFEGERNGRYFTYLTEDSFGALIRQVHDIKTEKMWISNDVRADRGEEQWLNLILKKMAIC